MRTSWMLIAPAIVASVVAGCDLGFETAAAEPVVFANVAGHLEQEYTGTGAFRAGSVPRRPPGIGPQLFQIDSHGTGEARGMRFHFTRTDLALPAPGIYPIGSGADRGFTAQLVIAGARRGAEDVFMALGGELVITASSPERIEGTFRFEGVATCERVGAGAVSCVAPQHAPAHAPRVQVSGHFGVEPDR